MMIAAEYLAWEADQPARHEFLDGEVWAMAGAEDRHLTLACNIYMALRQHLHGSSCCTFMSDMKLHAKSANSYFYPDVFVTCSETDRASKLVKREPTLVVEVLSNSTDVYRRGADGLWVLHPFDPGQGIAFASVDLRIADDALYTDID